MTTKSDPDSTRRETCLHVQFTQTHTQTIPVETDVNLTTVLLPDSAITISHSYTNYKRDLHGDLVAGVFALSTVQIQHG